MSNIFIEINPNLIVDRQLLTFLLNSDDKISRMILNVDTEKEVVFLKYSGKPEMISYLLNSKVNIDDINSDSFDVDNYKLQNMKVGRVVKKLFNPNNLEKILDTDIEYFVNSYKSWFGSNELKFKIVQGEEMKKWYDEENYSMVSKGSLWKSCMRYKERLKFLDLYTKNSNIKLLILTSFEDGGEKLRGRALLWENVILNDYYHIIPGEIKIMDRIYSILDSDTILFKNWAYQNGYIHKLEQNSKSHTYFYDKNQILKLSLKVPIEKTSFDYYPYLDTFPYFNKYKGFLTNDEYNVSYHYELKQANGDIEREEEY